MSVNTSTLTSSSQGCVVLFVLCCAVQISGLLGHAARGDKKSPAVADAEVGIGGCCQWKLQGLDVDTTVAVLFEITGSGQSAGDQGGQVSIRLSTKAAARSRPSAARTVMVSGWNMVRLTLRDCAEADM